MIIIGAGLSGLIAGALVPEAQIFEAAASLPHNHKALLRFRSPELGMALGIHMREVTVRKGVVGMDWQTKNEATIPELNQYAQKVAGRVADRSIGDLRPVQRWIAPENLVELLEARCAGRISYSHMLTGVHDNCVVFDRNEEEGSFSRVGPLVSTAPMRVNLAVCNVEHNTEFKHAPIKVHRFRVPGADVNQTLYFPSPLTSIYRASITGDLLIVERLAEEYLWDEEEFNLYKLKGCFGIAGEIPPIDDSHRQPYGKIDPLPTELRRSLLLEMTVKSGLFSLGRFATWRNILLDDVLTDLRHIQAMAKYGSYDFMRRTAKWK